MFGRPKNLCLCPTQVKVVRKKAIMESIENPKRKLSCIYQRTKRRGNIIALCGISSTKFAVATKIELKYFLTKLTI